MENLHKDLEKLLSDSSITEDAKEVIKKLLKDDIERQKRLLEELEKSIMPTLDMIGVNNRNLKTFEVSLDFSKELAYKIPNEFVKVSESGISSIEAINELKPYGYKGFLIGENFMKAENTTLAFEQFVKESK